MSLWLNAIGYGVRSAEDGFSALDELQKEVPDILLADLNMPGMTGFELPMVVRIRFPSVKTIAMSGAYSGIETPSEVAADAFYPKGGDVASLLKMTEKLPLQDRIVASLPAVPASVRAKPTGNESSRESNLGIKCTECNRTSPYPLGGARCEIPEMSLSYSRSAISNAMAHSVGSDPHLAPA